MRDLWECAECGRRFVNPRQWHSCGNPELDEILAAASDEAAAIYEAVEKALRDAGDFRVHPQKTRIAFISRMTFGGVRLARRWADLSFIVERALDDPRIRRIELYGPTSFGHEVRLTGPEAVDDDVRGWLALALRRGDQETLDSRAPVEPAVGRTLEVLLVPLRSRVIGHDSGLALHLPRFAAEVFDAHPQVLARIGGHRYPGTVAEVDGGGVLTLDVGLTSLGLGLDDPVDVFLTADV